MFVRPRIRLATRNAAFLLLRRSLTPANSTPAAFPDPDVCLKRLVRVLTAHSVLNLVARQPADLRRLSEPLAVFSTALRARNATRNAHLARQLAHIGEALHAKSIPAVALKGGAELLDPVFTTSADRFLGDLDILVPEQAIDEAITTLRQLGFTDLGAPYDRRHRHAPALHHEAWPTAVELHTAATTASHPEFLPATAMLERARPSGVIGLAVPSRADRLCHLVLHAQVDSGRFAGRWILLRDVAEFLVLVEDDPATRHAVRDRFARAGARALFEAFEAAAGAILGVAFEPSPPDRQALRWANQVLTRLAWPEIHRCHYVAARLTDCVPRLARDRAHRTRQATALKGREQRIAFIQRHLMHLRGFQ